MIRLVHLLRRRADCSVADFAALRRDQHGPLVAGHQVRLGILRYTQLHRDPDSAAIELAARSRRGGMAEPFDGVDEYWFHSEEALALALSGAAGRDAEADVCRSLAAIADLGASPCWFAHEYPQVCTRAERVVARPRTGVIKVLFPLCPLPALADDEAQRYWRTMHGPLVRSHAVARGSLCYQQVHRCASPLWARLRAVLGTPDAPHIGHAEAWFDRLAPRTGYEAAAAEAAALDDEQRFIDWSRSTFMIGKELVFIDRDWA